MTKSAENGKEKIAALTILELDSRLPTSLKLRGAGRGNDRKKAGMTGRRKPMPDDKTRLELPVELFDRIRRELAEGINGSPSALLLEDQKISAAFSAAIENLCKSQYEISKEEVYKFADGQAQIAAAAIAAKLRELGEAALKERFDAASKELAKEVIGELQKEAGQLDLDKESIKTQVLLEVRKNLGPRTEVASEIRPAGAIGAQIEKAIELLGRKNVFGPEEVAKTWGVRLAEIPKIPFSFIELAQAAKMGQMLVLRVDKTADGRPMSLSAMTEIVAKKWKDQGKGGLLRTAEGWKQWIGTDRFTKESPRAGWALVSKDVLPGSLGKNYIKQTEVVIATLRDEAFKGMDVPKEYAEAIAEFESKKDRLTELIDRNRSRTGKELSELKITQITRQTFSEAIYDLAAYHDANNERLLSNKQVCSASLNGAYLVNLGEFIEGGIAGNGPELDNQSRDCGASLSRRL